MLSMNIIGTGQLGQTLAALCVRFAKVKIKGLVNRTLASSESARMAIGQGTAYDCVESLPHADLTLIATPDASIKAQALALLANPNYSAGDVVFHCSAVQTSALLSPLSVKGIHVASIHPMMSFKTFPRAMDLYRDVPCAAEGDPLALAQLIPLFSAIGSLVYEIDKDQKSLYHVAGVMASNYLVTLAHQARVCLEAAGISSLQSKAVLKCLLESTCDNIVHASEPKEALTGPLQRGDYATVAAHLDVLSEDMKTLYKTLGLATLALIPLDEDQKINLTTLLS